jgi:putative DNA primase/helicase
MPDGNSSTAASPAEARTHSNPDPPSRTITAGEIATRAAEIKQRDDELADNEVIFGYTDLGNGQRFRRDHGDVVRYAAGSFYVWDGVKWLKDRGDRIQRLAKQSVEWIKSESTPDLEARKRHFKNSQSLRAIDAMIKMARSEMPIPAEISEFDLNENLLNVQNGTIDLKTGTLREHSRLDLITKCAAVKYDPDARCPTFLEFLATSQSGDLKNVSYIKRLLGYSLTGSTYEKGFAVIWGPTDTGKTVFINTIRAVLGEYAGVTPSDTFAAKQSRSGRIPNDIARLRGLRMVIASESEQGDFLHEGLIKQFTGGDMMTARFLHQEFFEFRPNAKIWFVTNHVPRFHGGDTATGRRFWLVPFTVRIDRKKQDPNLAEKLTAESEGILAWIVEGCLEWQQGGLRMPDKIQNATDKLIADNDDVGQFIDEECIVGPVEKIGKGDLYARYSEWARSGSRGALGIKNFNSAMEVRGFTGSDKKERIGGRARSPQKFWTGIRLREAMDPADSDDSDRPF